MKIISGANSFINSRNKYLAGSAPATKSESAQSDNLIARRNLFSFMDKISLNAKTVKKSEVRIEQPPLSTTDKLSFKDRQMEDWHKQVRAIAMSHLRSKVGSSAESGSFGDFDKNGVISFNDLGILRQQMHEGDYEQAVNIAFEGIRSRVGQQTGKDGSNELFDLNNDGVISMADLAYLRELMSRGKSE
ncbi:MAG TPA: dockerin type I domain-containing protein [Oligoflexia bacterium]|nr:dockerin type I domain-containing protein [Oligoflexia bacterium]HMP47314.1 dockerin type I domain-containing protein [Oligoflexia bacterium]